MKTFDKILIVDDDRDVMLAAQLFLKQHAGRVDTEADPNRIPELLQNDAYDVILLDMNFAQDATSGKEGFHWLRRILEMDASAVVVLITAFGDVKTAVQAIKEGATDFVLKPWQNEKLLATLSAAARLRRSRLDVFRLRSRPAAAPRRPGQAVSRHCGRVSGDARRFRIHPQGRRHGRQRTHPGRQRNGQRRRRPRPSPSFRPRGPGLHPRGPRRRSRDPLRKRTLRAQKGAFTDAREDRAGRFETASGGTLFLDEVGNLSLPLQAKLLTVLEKRNVFRLGTNKPVPIDIRLVCATNTPIHELAARNEFRQDLLYRVNTVEIRLPPLRDRREDLPLLIGNFLDRYCRKYKKPRIGVHPHTLKKLKGYSWPGNVRELQHAIERAVIMNENGTLQPSDFPLSTPDTTAGDHIHCEDFNLERIEKTAIRKAIEKHEGNISHTARELGITRSALYRRLEKYGL